MNAIKNPRILVVETDDPTAHAIEVMLKKHFSADVQRAASLTEARRKLSNESFVFITLGYSFQDGNGLELLKEIQSGKLQAPVIMITAYGSEEIASRAISAGAAGYVVKNDDMEITLAESVERALKQADSATVEQALKESESFYRSLFVDSVDALFVETVDGAIEDANEAAETMLGYSRSELAGMPAIQLVPPSMRADFESAQEILLGGGEVDFENITKEGRHIPVRVRAREVLTRRGPRYLISARDVSAVKQAERDIESERRFRDMALNAIQEIFVLVDADNQCTQWNDAVREVTRYGDEEIRTMAFGELFRREDFSLIMSALDSARSSGKTQKLEGRLSTRDARQVPFDITAAPVKDERGQLVAVAVLGRDISDRKRAEEALRNMVRETNERREEITALLESTRLVLERKDFLEAARDIFRLCKKLIGASAGMVALFDDGRSNVMLVEPESLKDTLGAEDVMPAADLERADLQLGKAYIENDVAAGRTAQDVTEERFPVRNLCIAPLMIESRAVGFIGLVNKQGGFTKRDSLMAAAFGEVASLALQNAQYIEMLQQSEERFRSVAETANDAIICADIEARIIFWNPGAAALFGYSSEEITGESLTIIIPERLREARIAALHHAVDSAGVGTTYESTGLRKDGSEFFMEMSRSAPWSIGEDIYFTAIIRDITARKEAEAALQRSEAEYRAVVDEQTELITRFVPGARTTFVNETSAKYFGRTREEMLNMDSFLDLVPVEDHYAIKQSVAGLSPQEPTATIEHRAINGRGETRWQQWTNTGIFNPDGDLVEVQGVGRDITDRHMAEEALKESEQKYKLLFDSAPDVIYSLDAQARITGLNQAFETLTGSSVDEWMGAHFAPLVHPEDLDLAIKTFEEASSGIAPEPYELRLRCRNGEYVTGEFISKPLMLNGEPVGEFGIARDITARRRAEQALAESEELYKALLATSPDSVVVTDLDLQVKMVSNKAVEQQRADGPEELLGMNALDILMPESRDGAVANIRRTVEQGLGRPMDFLLSRRDGTVYNGELMASVMRDRDGEPRAFIATIRDVTERKAAERELQALNNELEGYAHVVSHDLKGPLASISAASGTIKSLLDAGREAGMSDAVVEMASIIINNVEKANDLIDSLLDLAEASQKPVDARRVDIRDVVHEVLEERREEISTRHVKVRAERDLGTVVASPTHMYQLFSNLIDNAIKHNTAKKPLLVIEYKGRDETGGHHYIVKDNGAGIPPGQEKMVFLPFFAGEPGRTGVGLATVSKIVEVYGGYVKVASDDGAVFDFVVHDAG